MKTEVLMKRELLGTVVHQQSKTEFLSLTDLGRAGNKWRMANGLQSFDTTQWLKNKNTIEFIAALEKKHGKAKISARGRGQHTWAHPLLFIDMALAMSPELKIEVYEWLFDHLIKNRNDSGDTYKKMAGSLYALHSNKAAFPSFISKVADAIRLKCNVEDWQQATEEQLSQRNQIHNAISLLCNVLRNTSDAVRIGIAEGGRIK